MSRLTTQNYAKHLPLDLQFDGFALGWAVFGICVSGFVLHGVCQSKEVSARKSSCGFTLFQWNSCLRLFLCPRFWQGEYCCGLVRSPLLLGCLMLREGVQVLQCICKCVLDGLTGCFKIEGWQEGGDFSQKVQGVLGWPIFRGGQSRSDDWMVLLRSVADWL